MPRRRVPRSRRYIKKLAERMDERRKENPKRKVELWAFDEHRVGLKPILRRQWAPKRQRPIARGQHRFEWLYLRLRPPEQRGGGLVRLHHGRHRSLKRR